MTFDRLKSECIACTKCELCETRTNVVFGDGASDAKMFVIGEAPGKNEDEQGIPFVGKSGQLLDKLLQSVNLTRDKNVFISNIIKCRPPENRDPQQSEWNACMPYLQQQIEILQPKVIVCLGRIAAQRIIRADFSVMREHGEFVLRNGAWLTATLHPAALLRNPNNKPLAQADFAAIRKKIDEIEALSQGNGAT